MGMSSKEIVKALRRGLFSHLLLELAADKIEELENKLAELQDHPTEKSNVTDIKYRNIEKGGAE